MARAAQNPVRKRGTLISRDVVSLAYIHAGTKHRGPYEHDYAGTGVRLFGLPDGSLLLKSSNGRRLWNDFVVGDDE